LVLDRKSKSFLKLNLLLAILAWNLANRPDLEQTVAHAPALLSGRQAMSTSGDASNNGEVNNPGVGGVANDGHAARGEAVNNDLHPDRARHKDLLRMKVSKLRLHKSEGFPALLSKGGRLINTAELPSFEARLDSWASGAGLEALCSVTESMVQLSDNNAQVLTYFGNSDLGHLTTADQKRKFFQRLAETDMGASMQMTDDEECWHACSTATLIEMEQKLTTISAQISRNLAEALIVPNTNHSTLPQFFESTLALAFQPDTPRMVKGFIQLQQLRNHLNRDVQGSYLQQQNKAVKKFEDTLTTKLGVMDAQRLLVDSYAPAHIIAARDPDSRTTFYRRLTFAATNMVLRAC
jgi:hypothetical protein